MNIIKKTIILFCLCILLSKLSLGQSHNDSLNFTQKKNVVHWNITPLILWDASSLVPGYERLINKNHSLNFSVGYQNYPRYKDIGDGQILSLEYARRTGFRAAIEYRFYLESRNVHPAPDGLYIGPYLSYFIFNLENNLNV